MKVQICLHCVQPSVLFEHKCSFKRIVAQFTQCYHISSSKTAQTALVSQKTFVSPSNLAHNQQPPTTHLIEIRLNLIHKLGVAQRQIASSALQKSDSRQINFS